MFKVLALVVLIIAVSIGFTIWEFHYLIDIVHAPNYAVFIFIMLSWLVAGTYSGTASRR